MGLDQYLTGRKFMRSYEMANPPQEDGFEVEAIDVRIGYWRKHPDLHGYIVKHFASKDENGQPLDDCKDIELAIDQIHAIINALQEDKLEHGTSGFFFGASPQKTLDPEGYIEQQQEDLQTFGKAVLWLTNFDKEHCWRSVVYRASW